MKKYKDKDWLYQMYWVENLTMAKIAELCDVGSQTIFRWLWRFKIKTRTVSESKMGEKNNMWKGGRLVTNGYMYILKPSHPNANSKGYVAEHRLVIEEILGRYLKKGETPHHKNRIKNDNRPENLSLFSSHSQHLIFHKKNEYRSDKRA